MLKNQYFKQLLSDEKSKCQYIGLGNPDANILFVGKEAGMESDAKNFHGSAEYWELKKSGSEYAEPYEGKGKLRNYNHTWQKYQKLYDCILSYRNPNHEDAKDYKINFVENIFTTELSNLHAPNSAAAKKLVGFPENLKKRKEDFFRSEFIQQFPIVLIFGSDKHYIETYPGEVCSLFNVKYCRSEKVGKSTMWVHSEVDGADKPKLLIHTRQLTNGAPNELICRLGEIVKDFIDKSHIKVEISKN